MGLSASIAAFRWHGGEEQFLNQVVIATCGRVVIGRYGGSTEAGADKNEDGALVWCADEWEFAALLDAHYSTQSAALVVAALESHQESLAACLALPVAEAFTILHARLMGLFGSPDFRAQCRQLVGEASCLICARKDRFLWWLCIGDVVVYVLHPELARQGQFALNQRSYYEWVGKRNTFDLTVPCYASGVRQLVDGRSRIVMTTDGLLEYGARPFENPSYLYQSFRSQHDLEAVVAEALQQVHAEDGSDSATIIAWDCTG